MLKSYKYRIYPTDSQQSSFLQSMGSMRYVYNWALETRNEHYKRTGETLGVYELQTLLLTKKKELDWLQLPDAGSLRMPLYNLDEAYQRFFAGVSEFPVFKRKTGRGSIQYPQRVWVDFKANRTKIPKIGQVYTVFDRKFEGKIKTCTVSKTPTNKFYISILVDDSKELPAKAPISIETTIGIDLGLKDFAVFSTGDKIANPHFLKNDLKRLKVLQQRASKKIKGSNNQRKANLKVAKLYEQITNKRTNFLHQLSTKIIRENQTIVLEDLNVAGMLKNHKLAQAISDVSWSEFVRQLKYKADWYGKNILQIGRFEPSTKSCSGCGFKNDDLTLKDREWTCQECHVHHDRDINAAINIKALGLLQAQQTGQELPEELAEVSRKKGNRRSKKQSALNQRK